MRHTDISNLDPHTQAEQVTSTQHLRDLEALEVAEIQPVERYEAGGNRKGAENPVLRAFASLGLWVTSPKYAARRRSPDLY